MDSTPLAGALGCDWNAHKLPAGPYRGKEKSGRDRNGIATNVEVSPGSFSLERGAAQCRVIDGNPQEYDPEDAEGCDSAARIDNRVAEEQQRCNYEDRGNYGITRNSEWRLVTWPPPEDEHRRDRQRIERHDRRDKGVGELLEGSEEHEQHDEKHHPTRSPIATARSPNAAPPWRHG